MTDGITRKELIRGLFSYLRERSDELGEGRSDTPRRLLRPPGALWPDESYLAACTACEKCVAACPPGALFLAKEGDRRVAVLDPKRRACVLCSALPCIAACPDGALQPLASPARARMGVAQVDPRRCLTFRGQACDRCVALCPLSGSAIVQINGRPLVRPDDCTGCGVCVAACPEPGAIEVHPERELIPGVRLPHLGPTR